jgi:ActR/RegA family two-component response regulator
VAKRRTDDFDPRPRVAQFVRLLVEDTRRVAKGGYAKQLAAAGFAAAETAHLRRVLAACGGNKSEAARLLLIDRRSLQRKLARKPKRKK